MTDWQLHLKQGKMIYLAVAELLAAQSRFLEGALYKYPELINEVQKGNTRQSLMHRKAAKEHTVMLSKLRRCLFTIFH